MEGTETQLILDCPLEHPYDYDDIIDDLTNDLANLSTAVTTVRADFDRDDIASSFEASLRQLEAQNDLLQSTVQSLLDDSKAKNSELSDQIACLQETLQQKDIQYEELCSENKKILNELSKLKMYCKCSGSRAPMGAIEQPLCSRGSTAELQDLKTVFEILQKRQLEIGSLQETIQAMDKEINYSRCEIKALKCSLDDKMKEVQTARNKLAEFRSRKEQPELRGHIIQLSKKLAQSEQQKSILTKQLSDTTNKIDRLEQSLTSTQKQCAVGNSENALLREEIFALKEGQACFEGMEKSLRDHLDRTQEELVFTRNSVVQLNSVNEENEKLRENCRRLKNGNFDVVKKYNDLIEEYNKLDDEYSKLTDINENLEKELEALRCWKAEQLCQDEHLKRKLQLMESHIESLNCNRKELVNTCNDLNRDNHLLRDEMDFIKASFPNPCPTQSSVAMVNDHSADVVSKLIQNMRQSTIRMSQSRLQRENDKGCI